MSGLFTLRCSTWPCWEEGMENFQSLCEPFHNLDTPEVVELLYSEAGPECCLRLNHA